MVHFNLLMLIPKINAYADIYISMMHYIIFRCNQWVKYQRSIVITVCIAAIGSEFTITPTSNHLIKSRI